MNPEDGSSLKKIGGRLAFLPLFLYDRDCGDIAQLGEQLLDV